MKSLPGILGLVFLLMMAVACGGGGGGSSTGEVSSGSCADGKGLCLLSCNLGCSNAGCAISDIAVNQVLIFQFNAPLDPKSVNEDSFSIKTATGTTPSGTRRVSGSTVYFLPEIREVGSQTFFGFEKGNTYTIHLAAGPSASSVIQSASGVKLDEPLTCSIVASLDVIDLDEKNPSVQMIVPSPTVDVDPSTSVVLKFSEFVLPSTVLDPSAISMKVAQKDPTTGMVVPLERFLRSDQLTNLTEVTLYPKVPLPGSINAMVTVNSVIRDLSGKSLKQTKFFFSTKTVPTKLEKITEDFSTKAYLSPGNTGALWGNGELALGYVGGAGILGEFNHTIGSLKVGSKYVFKGNSSMFPGSVTLDGKAQSVTNGVFEFINFNIPAGVTVRFEGPDPIKIYVRGSVSIEGTLEVDGLQPLSTGMYNSVGGEKGMPGGAGGPGAGAGGAGGGEPGSGQTPDGKDGASLTVPAGHPRTAGGNGGKGSPGFPKNAQGNLDPTQIKLDYFSFFSIQFAGLGGPGAYLTQGVLGSVKESSSQYTTTNGPSVALATTFDPLPLGTGSQVVDQVLIGGAGGGGAGVSPYGSMQTQTDWQRGNGGGGGGGALALRAGGDIRILSTGRISARGGMGGYTASGGTLTPGGAGSGGTILLQTGGNVLSTGVIDVRGGAASPTLTDTFFTHNIVTAAGGNGYLRVEAVPAPNHTALGTIYPTPAASNVGLLGDRDTASGAESTWYSTGRLFPKLHHYEIVAMIGSQRVVYTDDKASPNPCVLGTTPVAIFFKGAQVDENQEIIPTSVSKFVPRIEDLLDSGTNGGVAVPPQRFMWAVVMDKGLSGGQDIKILSISVVVSD